MKTDDDILENYITKYNWDIELFDNKKEIISTLEYQTYYIKERIKEIFSIIFKPFLNFIDKIK